jgi:tRNA-splicing ligase RtcB (3'-phosphate/5'-hydroxy nucleic acid ligase)
MGMKELIEQGKAPIRLWEPDGCPMEPEVLQQVRNVAQLPVTEAVCLMPDGHWGMGGPVGGVIATRSAIVPALVGVDIGCGMMAQQLDMPGSALDSKLPALRSAIEAAVPHGGPGVKGSWSQAGYETPSVVGHQWATLAPEWTQIVARYPKLEGVQAAQLGTLGTGNHFIEICVDTAQNVWVMLHSGSRGPGNRIGSHFIQQARAYALKQHRALPDRDLGWLDDGTVLFDDYRRAVLWAQRYASTNRAVMMRLVLDAIAATLGRPIHGRAQAVNCHHNYVEERDAGLYVTRKGAVSARQGELGIIPGSMGAQSFIVAGRGAPAAYESCSHGAGRRLSRGRAKRVLTLADHEAATAGVECRKDAGVLDESPAAYKDIAAVMAAQADLVEVVATLKQVVCVKG